MRLIVLGSNGTYATPGRPASGYVVEHDGDRVWVDAGSGTCAAFQERFSLASLDALVITHVHPDHSTDVFMLYHALRYGPVPRAGVPVLAPEGVVERIVHFLQANGEKEHGLWEVFDFREARPGEDVTVGGIELGFALTDHPVPTVGVRARAGGRTLVYSSDTGPGGEVGRLAEGADLFLCEATYQGSSDAKPWGQHLTAGEAGEIGRQAGVERLVLTHLWPGLDPQRSVAEAEEAYGRPVGLAVPGMEIKV